MFDLPAKAAILNMRYFNGQYACITCEELGQTVKQGKGPARCFPNTEMVSTHYDLTTVSSNACGLEQ